ncbi:mucin-2-like [Patella vulgata]|uniref:mucin-2-like n=1 Tax=Patella vulgata TaxID=6465 RepID=UPI00217F61C4|nr:mucin-2-like [Patella vulgata]
MKIAFLWLMLFWLNLSGVNPQCHIEPKIQDGFSVDNLHEGENQLKQLTCITCTCNGDPIAHYVVELVSINFPTYCRQCFSMYNLTNVIKGSPPNYCLYYVPGVIPVSYRRGSVFDMTIRCTVENTATTPIPTTTPEPNPTVPVSSLPECKESTTAPEMLTQTTVTTRGTTASTVTDTTASTVSGPTESTVTGTTASTDTDTGNTASTDASNTGSTDTDNTASTYASSTASTDTDNTPSTDASSTASTDESTTASTDTDNTLSTDASSTASTDTSNTPSTYESTTASTNTDNTASTDTSSTTSTYTGNTASTDASTTASTVSVPCKNRSSATQIPTTSVKTVPDIVTTPTPGTIPPFLTAEGRIQVRVIPNRPPVFNPLAASITKNAIGVNDGGIVYTVPVTDPEGDPIYFTMSVDPQTTNFYIDGSGNIRAVKTLSSECSAAVYTFNVTATDDLHDPVGPHVATVRLSGTSTAPTARGLNREFFYEETVRVPTFIAKWSVSSDTKRTVFRFNPSSARTRFNIVSTTIRTSQEMDFETFPRINITFTFSNDHCQSKYYLLIRIGNVNDVPKLGPAEQSIKVSEGQVSAQPSYTITDGDYNDRHTFSFYRDRSSGYNINPFTGNISHPTGVVIDKIGVTTVSFQVVVTDELGPTESNKVLVKLLIQDINNHAPEFMVKSFTKSATACDLPQELGIKLEISDQDSSQFGNSDHSIIPVTSGPLTVTPDGTVYMTKAVVPGETYMVQAYAKDHGTNPGPLTSIVPVTITLIGEPCPTQFPTATPKPTTPAANSGSAMGDTGASGGSISINQNINSNTNNNAGDTNSDASASASATTDETTDATAAIVLGTLLGLLLLAGLLYLLYRFCLPRFFPDAHYSISNAFSNCSERCCPRNYNATEPIRGGQGKNTDFWKEGTNNNRNYKNTNNRYTRPLPYQYDSKIN